MRFLGGLCMAEEVLKVRNLTLEESALLMDMDNRGVGGEVESSSVRNRRGSSSGNMSRRDREGVP
jgi:hypothetical protein